MKRGTPGFVGFRLREAREARGLSTTGLADILGISRAAISQYENSQSSPGPDILNRLTIVLNEPVEFFLSTPRRSNAPIFFRSRAATTVAARTRAAVLLNWLGDIAEELWRHLEFPSLQFTPFDPPTDPLKLDREAIEAAAADTRKYWGLGDGPISNMTWLLESKGAIVTRAEIEEPLMDSFSRYDEDTAPFIFLNADKASAVRSRLDAAHELAHCVLHRAVTDDYWSTDAKVAQRETQAYQFAGAFLLPRERFASDVLIPSLETFLSLKPKWKVSISAMLMRAAALGLTSEQHEVRLWRSLARRGWRTHEPLDDVLEPEAPHLLRKAFEVLAEQNAQAPLEVRQEVTLAPGDVTFLTMLPPDYFDETDINLVPFKRKIH